LYISGGRDGLHCPEPRSMSKESTSFPTGAGRRLPPGTTRNSLWLLHNFAGATDNLVDFVRGVTGLVGGDRLVRYGESPRVPQSHMGSISTDACSVSERAKLYAATSRRGVATFGALCAALLATSCARERVTPVYDPDTRTVTRLDYDAGGDGRLDMRSYLQDGRGVRLEADGNGDGRVDRWEYYRPDGQLDRLGTSSQGDGREDTWVVQSGNQMRVDISTRRDGVVDRHEFHQQGVLVRAELDTDLDGRIDEWQRFENGKLRELLVDTERSGRPDRRLVYATNGSLERIEDARP
jgi:hypothetical protein